MKSPRILTAGTSGESGDTAYWKSRQDELRIETNGERLKPDEVLFCERLRKQYPGMPLSNVLVWLRQYKTIENDFIWLAKDGLKWELKSTRGRYSNIHDLISLAAKTGVKDRFIIDIGRGSLINKLRAQLAKYNVRNPHNQITELWVLSSDGKCLDRIELLLI